MQLSVLAWDTTGGNKTGEGRLMDVTRIISELRSEQEKIEQEIRFLERADRHGAGTTEAAAHSVTEIRKVGESDAGA